ncbi:hypothetical protein CMU59_17580 [Elizabethkingia anophelis]|nr:hypothetical protein [Elizabethkingia anophelis]MDV3576182.1 hypothetical protein [Elizabethkingia anophelis]MDV3601343.1 hypothetical protein [Elizabethkingia anophelis]MDV3608592.1 hypothetical protein [Elizabethkingia anophelis]MDV3640455.1 hypothetical protein [Elizabethkingia anophelis]
MRIKFLSVEINLSILIKNHIILNKQRLFIYCIIPSFVSSLSLSSCRVNDVERDIDNLGPRVSVSLNVLGSAFSDAGDESSSRSASLSPQEESVLVDPSTVLIANLRALSPLTPLSASTKGGLGATAVAATPGSNLTSGTTFRVIAYDSSGNYNAYQDYVVGAPPTPLMLNAGSSYTIVVYSYNSTSALPAISSGELGSLSSASVPYDDSKRDFMYYSTSYTPNSTSNTLNITLRHKVAQITTTLVSGILNSQIEVVANGLIGPHYSNGTFSLSTGNISGQTTLSGGSPVDFSSAIFPSGSVTSSPVFVNSNSAGINRGRFTADVTIGGTFRNVVASNSFKITPGYQSALSISLVKCGAYLGAGNTNWKNFTCSNIGSNPNSNPFIAQSTIQGNKYQWGGAAEAINAGNDLTNTTGTVSGWKTTVNADGSWLDNGTVNNPCPTGYRIPSAGEWNSVLSANAGSIVRIGTWTSSPTNYSSAISYGPGLFLPAAGERSSANGTLSNRGSKGSYWASSQDTSPNAFRLTFDGTLNGNVAAVDRRYGFPVRCIEQ